MKIAIMTDDNSGIPVSEAAQMGVFMMPMPFFIDGKLTYQNDGFTHRDFYEKLAQGADVSTSQPSPGDVMDMWNDILNKGYDDIVYIPMSSGLSASCENARIFSEEFDGRVHVVDNHRISVTMENSVINAVNYVSQGMNAADIKERLEREAYESTIFITVEDLAYLKKGGRITASALAIGSILNIKPVLTIQGGKLDAFARERGMKKARHTMIEAMRKEIDTRFREEYENGKFRICISYSDVDDETLQSWKEEVLEAFPVDDLLIRPLSLSIGCHIGPGALAIAGCI